jgi:hypothetical protein
MGEALGLGEQAAQVNPGRIGKRGERIEDALLGRGRRGERLVEAQPSVSVDLDQVGKVPPVSTPR